jgi:hypothetical protein
LRFAISLPKTVTVDAENGRLSATSFCHAPALSADAPLSVFFLPEAANTVGRLHSGIIVERLILRFTVTAPCNS